MNKRSLGILLLLVMLLALLPFSALAAQNTNPACFQYLKDYLIANGAPQDGVYTYSGTESAESINVSISLTYDPAADALIFADSTKQGFASIRVEMTVPAAKARVSTSATSFLDVKTKS